MIPCCSVGIVESVKGYKNLNVMSIIVIPPAHMRLSHLGSAS